jgi:hypothetical protein
MTVRTRHPHAHVAPAELLPEEGGYSQHQPVAATGYRYHAEEDFDHDDRADDAALMIRSMQWKHRAPPAAAAPTAAAVRARNQLLRARAQLASSGLIRSHARVLLFRRGVSVL